MHKNQKNDKVNNQKKASWKRWILNLDDYNKSKTHPWRVERTSHWFNLQNSFPYFTSRSEHERCYWNVMNALPLLPQKTCCLCPFSSHWALTSRTSLLCRKTENNKHIWEEEEVPRQRDRLLSIRIWLSGTCLVFGTRLHHILTTLGGHLTPQFLNFPTY